MVRVTPEIRALFNCTECTLVTPGLNMHLSHKGVVRPHSLMSVK